jgi:uncharacterized protein involved in exopolysaccharide biosynthesis
VVSRRMPFCVSLAMAVLASLAFLLSSGPRFESRMMLLDPSFLPFQDAGLYEV